MSKNLGTPTITLIIACFLLWLLPLGRFIDRAHEAQACGGQRAICLCSTQFKAVQAKAERPAGYAHQQGHNQQRSAAGAASHDLEFSIDKLVLAPKIFLPLHEPSHLYSLLISRLIDSVPKA